MSSAVFDEFVAKHNCEKISTLGDCYFCVSGCPEPEPQHADNCVNMGLAIIEVAWKTIAGTDTVADRDESGNPHWRPCSVVLWEPNASSSTCGRRDVRIANQIESASTPGRVLISQSTRTPACLGPATSWSRPRPRRANPSSRACEPYYVSSSTEQL